MAVGVVDDGIAGVPPKLLDQLGELAPMIAGAWRMSEVVEVCLLGELCSYQDPTQRSYFMSPSGACRLGSEKYLLSGGNSKP